jgi:hypothetical protein
MSLTSFSINVGIDVMKSTVLSRIFAGAFIIILASVVTPMSHAEQWGAFWDDLAKQPRVKITDSVNSDGEERRIIELPSGVEFILERHGDKITSAGNDTSGHGAVMCSFGLLIAARAQIGTCSPGEDRDLEADLDNAIDRISEFIVENSLQPVKKEVEDYIEDGRNRTVEVLRGQSDEDREKKCHSKGASFLTNRLKSMSREQRRPFVDVTELLSVKRPPVLNPCL